MFRVNLGPGAVAFETEGEADRVSNVNPRELTEHSWPQEVIENFRKYQKRLTPSSNDDQ